MTENSNNFFPFIRDLKPEGNRVYSSNDLLRFRPSYEYLQTRESYSCFHCKSLVYQRSGDVKVLSLLEIVVASQNTPFFNYDNVILDTMFSVSKKIDNFFGSLFGDDEVKKNIEKSCHLIQDKYKIDSSLLTKPLFHRCPTCLYAWPLHLEIKQRIHVYSYFDSRLTIPSIARSFRTIPLSKNFLAGIIIFNNPAEEGSIGLHILGLKRFQVQHNKPDLLPEALKKIRISDAAGSLSDLMEYTSGNTGRFFSHQVQLLQARLSNYNRERIGGRLSPKEESIEFNRICSDIFLLIEEIERYKNM
jgi:hypothetical protein